MLKEMRDGASYMSFTRALRTGQPEAEGSRRGRRDQHARRVRYPEMSDAFARCRGIGYLHSAV